MACRIIIVFDAATPMVISLRSYIQASHGLPMRSLATVDFGLVFSSHQDFSFRTATFMVTTRRTAAVPKAFDFEA